MIMAARRTNMMGPCKLAAVAAFYICLAGEPVVSAPRVALRLGSLLLWNRHQVLPFPFEIISLRAENGLRRSLSTVSLLLKSSATNSIPGFRG